MVGIECTLEADGDMIVQAGAGWMDINEALRDKGHSLRSTLFRHKLESASRHTALFPGERNAYIF